MTHAYTHTVQLLLGECLVGAGNEAPHGAPPARRVVVGVHTNHHAVLDLNTQRGTGYVLAAEELPLGA